MDSKTNRPRRRSIRLAEYDYAHPGAYFVTICAQDRELLFGQVADKEMVLSECGDIAWAAWNEIPSHFPNVESDISVIMPNHLHGIIIITDTVGAGSPGPQSGAATAPLPPVLVEAGSPGPQSGAATAPLPPVLVEAGSPGPQSGAATAPLPPVLVEAGSPGPQSGAATTPLPPVLVEAGSPGPQSGAATAPLQRPTLGQIVAYFKYQSTKRINQQRGTPGARVWQRNYFEHVIRNERALDAIRRYIENNPLRWELDCYNPAASEPDPDAQALWRLLKADPPPKRNRP